MHKFDQDQFVRISRKINESIGYLEFGLNDKALSCLEGLGPLGPLEAQVEIIRAEAFRREARFEDAAHSLERAVSIIPTPQNRPAFLALSVCYRQAGDVDAAIQALGQARGANLSLPPQDRGPRNRFEGLL